MTEPECVESEYVDHDSLTDAALLQRYQRLQDSRALATVVRRHHAVVFAVCRQLLGASHDADDAYQSVFLVLVRNAGKIRKPDSLSSWLYGVAYRVAMRIRTQRAKSKQESFNVLATSNDDPLVELARQDQRSATHDAIAALPESLRKPIVLRYLAGKSNREVAEELSMTEAAVEGRLKRAKSRMRGRLAQRGLMLSAALAAIETAAADGAEVSEQATAHLIDATVQRCERCSQARSDSLTNTHDASLTQIANQEATTMIRTQLARYAMGLAACGTVAIVTVAPRFVQRGHAQQPSISRQGAGQPEATVVVAETIDARSDQNPFAAISIAQQAAAPPAGAVDPRPPATPVPPTAMPTVDLFGGDQQGRATSVPPVFFNNQGAEENADDIARARIRAALKQKTKLDFFDEPLSDVLAHIEQVHGVQIRLDQAKLDEEGFTTDVPVNFQVSDITLDSALKLMLRDVGLKHTYRDEVLFVTTPDAVGSQLETRVYAFDEAWPMDADEIVEAISQHVSPDTWAVVGGNATVNSFPGGAIVTQAYDEHERIGTLLEQLRRTFAKSARSTNVAVPKVPASRAR